MKKVLKILGIILLVVVLVLGGFVAYLSIREYKPDDIETIDVSASESRKTFSGDTVKLISFNTGYAGLGDNADFFMDGGKKVKSTDEDRMNENMNEISKFITDKKADFYLLQEVDQNSSRSYSVNQVESYMKNTNLFGTFALNYSCPFVPFPFPPIGKVNSGILTLTDYTVSSAERVGLPCPFKWPISAANLKRCLLINRVPIEGSDKELVIVNLHLEAYDDGAGKAAQTQMLFSILQKEYEKGNYVIAGGDFNQTFPGGVDAYPIQNTETWTPGTLENTVLPAGWSFAYDTSVPTCRLLDKPYDAATSQHYVIDGFILSPNVEKVTVETQDLGFHAADHNPVYLEVKLK